MRQRVIKNVFGARRQTVICTVEGNPVTIEELILEARQLTSGTGIPPGDVEVHVELESESVVLEAVLPKPLECAACGMSAVSFGTFEVRHGEHFCADSRACQDRVYGLKCIGSPPTDGGDQP